MNSDQEVKGVFEYLEMMLAANRYLPPSAHLSHLTFNFYDWDARANAQPEEVTP